MALIKEGSLASGLSGTVGGVTFSRVATAKVARGWRAPVNKRSVRQRAQRQRFAKFSALWFDTLTQVQRDGWNSYAQTVIFTNSLGDPYTINGHQMYIRINTVNEEITGSSDNDAPTIPGLPVSRTVSLDLTHATGVLEVTSIIPPGLAADSLLFGNINFDRVTRATPRGNTTPGISTPGNFATPFTINTYAAPMPRIAGDWTGWAKFWYLDSNGRLTNAQLLSAVSS